MTISRFLIPVAALAMTAGAAFAQAPAQPATTAKPAAPVAAPAAQPAPAAQGAAKTTAAKPADSKTAEKTQTKVNINTARASELETLHGIGEVRAKKIVEERGKAKFKDYDDLVKRNVLPSNVEAGIKDRITF